MIVSEPIGFIHNACNESLAPELIKKEISEIEILPAFAEGLQDIEKSEYLDIVFSFHQEKRTELLTRIRTGETRGVFASRSPRRPNHVGVTTVRLLKREDNRLYVEGADALNGSPVIDIKYCDTSAFEQAHIHQSIRKDAPRIDIIRHIMDNNTEELLLKAAQIHGHICPGLALGVMSATALMQQLYAEEKNPLDYTLTVEMQNCPVDGALFVTGCTPGTHRFIMGTADHSCYYLTDSTGQGWKVTLRESNREYMQENIPPHLSPADKGFATLKLDPDGLFFIEAVKK